MYAIITTVIIINHGYNKENFESKNNDDNKIKPFYLVPNKLYICNPPKDMRIVNKTSKTNVKTSSFVGRWYCYCDNNNYKL